MSVAHWRVSSGGLPQSHGSHRATIAEGSGRSPRGGGPPAGSGERGRGAGGLTRRVVIWHYVAEWKRQCLPASALVNCSLMCFPPTAHPPKPLSAPAASVTRVYVCVFLCVCVCNMSLSVHIYVGVCLCISVCAREGLGWGIRWRLCQRSPSACSWLNGGVREGVAA